MRLNEFKKELRSRIAIMPEGEIRKAIDFYRELVLDNIDSGKTEEEAIRALGDIDTIAGKILSEYSSNFVKKRKIDKVLIIILLIFAAPILFGIAGALFGVLLSIAVVLLVCFLLGYIFVAAGVVGLLFSIIGFVNVAPFLLDLGMSFGIIGIGILFIILSHMVLGSIRRNLPGARRNIARKLGRGKRTYE
ncbi:MAG: DUF1700 domain-containing protein [Erysipelotrichales bacterium]|nr:DUF1700 domain-containing protein [Erysipelotrichales bacterium]